MVTKKVEKKEWGMGQRLIFHRGFRSVLWSESRGSKLQSM